MRPIKCVTMLAVTMLVAGCVRYVQPTISMQTPPHKPFEVFVAEDQECRDKAVRLVHQPSGQEQAEQAAISGLTWAAIMAATGAIIGATVGAPGEGAAIGAAVGGVGGAAHGAGSTEQERFDQQQLVNHYFRSCMISKGNDREVFQPQVYTVFR